MIKLEPCDVLVFKVEGDSLLANLERIFVGGWSHVSMYLGEAFGDHLIFESNLRGASLVNLESERGRLVKVMRPQITPAQKQLVIANAINLASDERAAYDYPVIIMSCIPRVLKTLLPCLPIPVKYCRDIIVMCAEGVAECYWRAWILILPTSRVPLPPDFAKPSEVLEVVGEGRLMEDVLP